MDLWNNEIGREISKEIRREYNLIEVIKHINSGKMDDIIAAKIMSRMKKGELITHPSDPRKYRTPAQKFSAEVKQRALELQESRQNIVTEEINELFEKVDQIAEFIRYHVGSVGKEQAIKDIQFAFNLLCNSKKMAILEELKILKEDGDLGQKTFACLKHVCKHYSTEVIKEYLKLGAMNNAIFETKDDNTINTRKLVEEIRNNLSLKGTNSHG